MPALRAVDARRPSARPIRAAQGRRPNVHAHPGSQRLVVTVDLRPATSQERRRQSSANAPIRAAQRGATVIPLIALAVPGLPSAAFHDPFHARRRAPSHGRHSAQRPGSRSAMPAGAAGHGPPRQAAPGHGPGRGGHRVRRGGPGRRHHLSGSTLYARRPGRARPAVPPRIAAPALTGIWDDERHMPARGPLASHAGDRGSHRPPGPGTMPGRAGDPGLAPSVLAPYAPSACQP